MTKLEDKLISSVKKPEQRKKTDKAQTTENRADVKPKETASAPAKQKQAKQKQKQAKQKQTSPGTDQSVLHPQRIWPD